MASISFTPRRPSSTWPPGKVDTTVGVYGYDYLVIATGYRNDFDAVEGLGPGGNAYTITTLADAQRAGRGWRRFLVGVDFSRIGLDKARQLAEERHVAIEWVLADVTTYQPARAAFDLVAILYLQLPAAPLAAALGRAMAALASGGTLLVVGHDIANLTHGYGGPRRALGTPIRSPPASAAW